MFYLLTFGNRKTFKFLEGVCRIVDCPNGKCSIPNFGKNDWVLAMIPTSKEYKIPPGGRKLNSNEAIDLSKNKPLARKIMIENGVPTPETWFNIDEVKIPYIARPKYHKQGKNFIVIRTNEEHINFKNSNIYDDSWYFSELLNIVKEVRIILLKDKVVYTYEFPVFSTPEETVKKRETVMGTSLDPGFKPYEKLTEEEKSIAVKAMHSIGLFYGTVDLMYADDGNYYITEINYFPNPRNYVQPHLKEAIRRFQIEN